MRVPWSHSSTLTGCLAHCVNLEHQLKVQTFHTCLFGFQSPSCLCHATGVPRLVGFWRSQKTAIWVKLIFLFVQPESKKVKKVKSTCLAFKQSDFIFSITIQDPCLPNLVCRSINKNMSGKLCPKSSLLSGCLEIISFLAYHGYLVMQVLFYTQTRTKSKFNGNNLAHYVKYQQRGFI